MSRDAATADRTGEDAEASESRLQQRWEFYQPLLHRAQLEAALFSMTL